MKVVDGIADELRLAVHLSAGQKAKLYLADDPSTVTWSALDTAVASVSETGEVTAVKKGLCIVQGEINGEIYNIYVRVE